MKDYNFYQIDFASPEYDEAVALRNKILRIPLGLEFTEEQLEKEWNEFHFVLKDQHDTLLACLIFKPVDSEILKMRQVTVDDKLQSKGIGSLLVKESELWAQQKAYRKIELHARDTAVEFYLKLGYEVSGPEFKEVGIPHRKMVKAL